MTRNSFFQFLTILALVAAIVFVAHNFVTYVLKVDGDYSHWTVFSECTKPCGIGTRFRTRTCDNPPPRFGGRNCSRLGDDKQTFRCNMNPCPVDGGYGEWGEFSKCTVTCGGGVRHRTRECNNPTTVLPGKTCEQQGLGSAEEMETCNVQSCPVDGGYTEWSEFGECSVTCGGGVRQRTRECTNPAPENNGKDCEQLGPAEESEICNPEPCPAEPPQDLVKRNKRGDKSSTAKIEE